MSRTRILLGVVALGSVLVLGLTYRWFVNPAEDEPQTADAVVMLGGGQGERLAKALELIDQDVAPVLTITNGLVWSKGIELCTSDDLDFEVLCPGDVPNTRGEAREIQTLAEERGWDSIVLVTNDFHIRRATTHVDRCFDGTIYRVGVEDSFSVSRKAFALAREWAGTVRGVFVRGC